MTFRICNRCKENKPASKFHHAGDTKDGRQRTCIECTREYMKLWSKTPKAREWKRRYENTPSVREKGYKRQFIRYRKQRLQLFKEICGGNPKCQCPGCDVSHWEFLQLDHINGGGNKQRKLFKLGGSVIVRLALKDPDLKHKYRVLCANCNHAIGRHKGICPVHNNNNPDTLPKT
jgi:hypothetical protein